MYLTTRCVSGGRISKLDILFIIAALCVFSSLPWVTSQILPDILSSVLLLGLFLLAFCTDQLRRGEFYYVTALTTASTAVHLSHVPIAAGLILLCIGLKIILRPHSAPATRWMAPLLVSFAVAVSSMMAINWMDSRALGLARNSNVFLLAKWIDEGPALSYLNGACPTVGYELCAHVGELRGLTHDDLKWGSDSPFKKVGTFDDLEPEARSIVWATLRAYPLEILQRAFADAARQIVRFEAGDGLSADFARMVAEHLAPIFGSDVAASLVQSRQGQGQLPIEEARRLHIVGLVVGLSFCLWLLIARRPFIPTNLIALNVFVIAGVLWNAIVTGALSGPYDRYLARVIWLVCFVGLLGLCYSARVNRAKQESAAATN
jgi:hypothetical protein